jgi:hypothetical protein
MIETNERTERCLMTIFCMGMESKDSVSYCMM